MIDDLYKADDLTKWTYTRQQTADTELSVCFGRRIFLILGAMRRTRSNCFHNHGTFRFSIESGNGSKTAESYPLSPRLLELSPMNKELIKKIIAYNPDIK